MKILDTEFNLFGHSCRFRFVPRTFHLDLGKVGNALFLGQVKEAETKLNQMRQDYCADGLDDKEMFYYRDQINIIKREVEIV